MASPEDILDKLPKKTPLWAVGLVSLIVAVSASFLTLYVVARPEIQQYMVTAATKVTAENARQDSEANVKNELVASILGIVKSNSDQITNLSLALQVAQTANYKLSDRVSAIERDLAVTQASLTTCEANLKKCK